VEETYQFLVIVPMSIPQLPAGLCPPLYYKMMMKQMKSGEILAVITSLARTAEAKD
jgi:hypothetical protein